MHGAIDGPSLEDIYYDGTKVEFEEMLNYNLLHGGYIWGDYLECTIHYSDGTSEEIHYECVDECNDEGEIVSRKYVSKN